MNSFQAWATDHATAHGFATRTVLHWVVLAKDGAEIECMSERGVRRACGTAAPEPYREELTPHGIQLTIPGTERVAAPGKPATAQLSLFG